MPCSAARARRLLKSGRARIARLYPFTIRLTDRLLEKSAVQPVIVKIDPGSRETGIAVVREDEKKVHHALAFFCLAHRGESIHQALLIRAMNRNQRRTTHLRYRKPRFSNRARPKGWLSPSLQHRVVTTSAWVQRLCRLAPVAGITQELVKFDTFKLEHPTAASTDYMHGELYGYNVREYLLEKFGRKCVYCGRTNVPLNVDHVVPKAAGGSNRLSNLVLACVSCNQKKGSRTLEDFLKGQPRVYKRVKALLKKPLQDAGAVNSTRWALLRKLKASTGLPIEAPSGALTKFNRHAFHVPKEHWFDAACAGRINGVEFDPDLDVLRIRCTGRGVYCRTLTNAYGFPRGYRTRKKMVHGFATGDMVEAFVSKGKKAGHYKGRVAVRKSGGFNIQTASGTVQGIGWRHCRLLQRGDGYGYSWDSALKVRSQVRIIRPKVKLPFVLFLLFIR